MRQDQRNFERLRFRQVGDFRLSQTAYAPGAWNHWHFHADPRFVFVNSGRFYEDLGAAERHCRPNTTIFRPAGERHREVYGKRVVCLSISLPKGWMEDLRDHSIALDDSADFFSPRIGRIFGRISCELGAPDNLTDLSVTSLLNEVAVEMQRENDRRRSGARPKWLSAAVDYLHENYTSSPDLATVANAASVHPVHLSRVFKREYGCTVADYMRRLRVEFASELLADPDLSLAEIALRAGFSDQSHFTRVFRQITSATPDQYRRARNTL